MTDILYVGIYFEYITSYLKFLNRILLFDKNISAPAKRKPNAELIKSPTGPWLLIDSTPMLVGCYELAENQPR